MTAGKRADAFRGAVGSRATFYIALPDELNRPERKLSGDFSTEEQGTEALAWLQQREPRARLFAEFTLLEVRR